MTTITHGDQDGLGDPVEYRVACSTRNFAATHASGVPGDANVGSDGDNDDVILMPEGQGDRGATDGAWGMNTSGAGGKGPKV